MLEKILHCIRVGAVGQKMALKCNFSVVWVCITSKCDRLLVNSLEWAPWFVEGYILKKALNFGIQEGGMKCKDIGEVLNILHSIISTILMFWKVHIQKPFFNNRFTRLALTCVIEN